MLILTRKLGESIQIGDDIRIKIVDVGRHFVKIGIDAPRTVKVHREEIYERIREENIRAGSTIGPEGLMEAARLLKTRGAAPAETKPKAETSEPEKVRVQVKRRRSEP